MMIGSAPATCDNPTTQALAALVMLIAEDVRDTAIIDEALAAVLGADDESEIPAARRYASAAGTDVDAPEECASSPLDRTVSIPLLSHVTVVDSDPAAGQSPAGALTPLEFAVLRQNVTAVKSLLKAGAHVDHIGGFNCTCLCKVCYACPENTELLRLLLAAGANPDATTNNDTSSASCLIIAVVKNNIPAVQALLEYGADVSYEWKGSNALAMALDFKKIDVAQLFENFEMRKAQRNRWARYQQRKQAEEDRLAAALVVPPTKDPSDPAALQETAADVLDSPQRQSRLVSSLAGMDWIVPLANVEILSPISSGAHGKVFKARLRSTGDVVALKKFTCHDARSREMFRREVEMLAKFRHENIVLFKAAVIEEGCSALLTELCVESLFDRLERAGPLPWSRRIRWAHDIAKGMTYLHARSPPVVHRDLKSLNVLLDSTGTVKLCDFGIARVRERTFIETQHIAGSPSWMAPEVLRGDNFNQSSDVYAFGVVMWELLTRQVPWPNKNMAQLVGLVGFTGAVLDVPQPLPEDCPVRFVELMQQCFLPAAQRPTFRQLREALEGLMTSPTHDVD